MIMVPLSPAFAQSPSGFSLDLWNSGAVDVVVHTPSGELYFAGAFTLADRTDSFGFARLRADGALDTTFAPNINGRATALTVLDDGDVVLGGEFTEFDGIPVARLARITSGGFLAAGWNVTLDARVDALHSTKSELYIAGRFTAVNGVARSRLARVSLDDGELDLTFSPTVNGDVLDFAVDDFGNIWLAGNFDQINGEPSENLVVLDSSGKTIRTFSSDAIIRSVSAVEGADEVYVCGDFTTVDDQARTSAARFSTGPDILLDAWQIAIDGSLSSCFADHDGVWLGGDMAVVNGFSRPGVARVLANGTVDVGFEAQLSGVYVGNPGSSARVSAISTFGIDGVVVGGSFSQVNDEPLSALAALDEQTGQLLQGYEIERPAEVRSAIVVDSDGSVVIGGFFRRSGEFLANNLVRLNPKGQVDKNWHLSSDGPILTAVSPGDNSLIVGGFFGEIGGESRLGLAHITNVETGVLNPAWQPEVYGAVHSIYIDDCLPDLIYVGGFFGLDANEAISSINNFAQFRLSGSGQAEPIDLMVDQQVNSIVQLDCDRLLIGGLFNEVAGFDRRGLMLVNKQIVGLLDKNFDANLNGSVWSLFKNPQSDSVFVGGEFTQILGQSRARLAELDSLILSDWNPGSNGVPLGMAIDDLGSLYVTGTFTNLAGDQRRRIARLSIDLPATLDQTFNPGSNGTIVWSAKVLGNKLFVSGNFSELAGIERRAIGSFSIPVAPSDLIFSDFFEVSGTQQNELFEIGGGGCDLKRGLVADSREYDRPFNYPPCPDE